MLTLHLISFPISLVPLICLSVCLFSPSISFFYCFFLLFLSCVYLPIIVKTRWYFSSPLFPCLRLSLSGHVSGVGEQLIAANYWSLISSFQMHKDPSSATCAAADRSPCQVCCLTSSFLCMCMCVSTSFLDLVFKDCLSAGHWPSLCVCVCVRLGEDAQHGAG